MVGSMGANDSLRSSRQVSAPQVALVLVLGLTFLAYCGTLGFQFVYDDRPQVGLNPWVHSWRYFPHYFTAQVWAGIYPWATGNYYRPLFLLWLRVNFALFGMAAWGWHLTSVLAHVAVTFLVYELARRIYGEYWIATVAAMVFGLHPAHVEDVAWISGVTDPLVALLLVSPILCYLKAKEQGSLRRAWKAGALALYVAAMLAKEVGIVLPVLIAACEWASGKPEDLGMGSPDAWGRIRRAAWGAVPFLALVPPYLVVRHLALNGLSHVLTPLPISTIVYTWPSLAWTYLRHLVWPFGLSPFYDLPYVTSPGSVEFVVPTFGVAGALFLLVAAILRTGRAGQASATLSTRGLLVFELAWIVSPILPLLNISVLPRGDIAHDRYLYLPSIGFSMLIARALGGLRGGRTVFLGRPLAQIVVAGALAVACAFGTATQSLMWADDLLLYYRGIATAPRNSAVKTNLANILAERGHYDLAVDLYQVVVRDDPSFWEGNYNIGYTFYKLGKTAEADLYLHRAIAIEPGRPEAYICLGLSLLKQSQFDEAERAIRQAIRVNPESGDYHFALGMALKLEGNFIAALQEFKADQEIGPGRDAAQIQIREIESHLRSAVPVGATGPGKARDSDKP